jgi:hypothetical protein
MKVDKVGIDLLTHDAVVILKDLEGKRYFPIRIGPFEATAIALALEGTQVPRPLSHDLMRTMLESLHATLEQIVIHDFKDSTFFALLDEGEFGLGRQAAECPDIMVPRSGRLNWSCARGSGPANRSATRLLRDSGTLSSTLHGLDQLTDLRSRASSSRGRKEIFTRRARAREHRPDSAQIRRGWLVLVSIVNLLGAPRFPRQDETQKVVQRLQTVIRLALLS